MKYLDNEQVIWESKNKQLLLTSHRLRKMDKSFWGSSIKSIMLEELTACELKATRQLRFLSRAIIYFLLINGSVYLFNHYLFNAELIKFLFGDVHIGPHSAALIFYFSIVVVVSYLALFAFSFKKTFSFYSTGLTIDFQLRWLDFEERESFISKVEATKDLRQRELYGHHRKDARKDE